MKLATLKDGSRDGQLVVVSRDLAQAHFANGIASRLQHVLDDWNFLSPQLEDLYTTLNQGKARHAFAFDTRLCMAPLPRAFQWAEGSAWASHGQRLAQAAGLALPEGWRDTPQLAQRAADQLQGASDEMFCFDAAWGIDFGAGLAAITGDVPMGASPEQALDGVRLLMLANSWSLRTLGPLDDPLLRRPATAFAPVAVTPDELGDAWAGGRVALPVTVTCHGRRLGLPDAGDGMDQPLGALIAQLARLRPVRAGSIVGTGTVSNTDPAKGFACLAEKRALEQQQAGSARTAWLGFGDSVRIDIKGRDGQSVFGTIDQRVVGPGGAGQPQAALHATDDALDDTHDDAGAADAPAAAADTGASPDEARHD